MYNFHNHGHNDLSSTKFCDNLKEYLALTGARGVKMCMSVVNHLIRTRRLLVIVMLMGMGMELGITFPGGV